MVHTHPPWVGYDCAVSMDYKRLGSVLQEELRSGIGYIFGQLSDYAYLLAGSA